MGSKSRLELARRDFLLTVGATAPTLSLMAGKAGRRARMAAQSGAGDSNGKFTPMSVAGGGPGAPGLGLIWVCALENPEPDRSLRAVRLEAAGSDRIEKVFFNAGPAPVARDFRTMCYYQSPNRYSTLNPKEEPTHPGAGSYRFTTTGHSVLCCVGNLNRIIPIYMMHMWMATLDGGLAATLYGPSTVQAKVADERLSRPHFTAKPSRAPPAREIGNHGHATTVENPSLVGQLTRCDHGECKCSVPTMLVCGNSWHHDYTGSSGWYGSRPRSTVVSHRGCVAPLPSREWLGHPWRTPAGRRMACSAGVRGQQQGSLDPSMAWNLLAIQLPVRW